MKHLLQQLLFLCVNILFSQQVEYDVFNTSINSDYAELGVTYLNENRVLFASSKKNDDDQSFKKDRRKNNSNLYLELYEAGINENNDLIQIGNFTKGLKNMFFESDITFTPDLTSVYFTWNNFYNTQKRVDSAKWKTLHVLKASVNKRFKVTNLSPLPFNSEAYTVRSPYVSKDGKQLYFVSDMPNGYGKNDIYVVDIYPDGTYSKPSNLGANINTKEDELYPFVDGNNTLYFSSYGHKGKGNLDIFKSNFKDGNYQKAENLPSPINSKFDDFSFVINTLNNTGYFTSNREQGKGDVDIYAFKLKKEKLNCNQIISGIVLNTKGEKLGNVKVSLFYYHILKNTKVLNFNKFNFKLECNKIYKIIAKKKGFHTQEIEVKTNNLNIAVISKNIILAPLKCTQLLTGIVLNKDTNLPLEKAKVSLYHHTVLKESQTISEGSKFNFELVCGENYKIITETKNYQTTEIEVLTNNIYNAEISKTITLTPLKCTQLLTGIVLNKDTNLPLEKAKVSLYHHAILQESQTISKGSKFNFKLVCGENYKIITETKNYQTTEIEVLTNNIYNAEISKTITLTPLKCTQLLTGIVLNKDTNLPLEKAKVSLYHHTVLKESQTISKGSKFNFELVCGENYKIITETKNYQTTEIEVLTNNIYNAEISKTITLIPLKCTQLLMGIVVNEETNIPLDKAKISLYHHAILQESQTISEESKFNFKLVCGENYKIITETENYQTTETEVLTNNIYNAEILKTITLTPLKCTQLLMGIVVNEETNIPIDKAKISLYHNNILKETKTINQGFNFTFELVCGEKYKIIVEKSEFNKKKIDLITTNNYNTEISKNISLTPLKCTQLLTGVVLDKDTNLPLTDAVLTIYKNNHIIDTLNLNNNAAFQFKIECSNQYRIVALVKNYRKDVIVIQTSRRPSETLERKFLLEPNVEFITIRKQKLIKTNPLQFDLDKFAINIKTAIELDKVVNFLKKYPITKIEIHSHTDSRAPDNYNLKLSNNRAQSSVDYIISKGIDPNRISGKGYGETQLLNKCTNGVKCSQAEHELNRRTEFIIIED